MKSKKKIEVQGIEIRLEPIQEMDYVSLTDIAKKNSEDHKYVVINWMKNANTLDFLEEWEQVHNPDFKVVQMDNFRKMHRKNRYIATPKKWVEATGAIGIVSRAGRYGGTYAHKDIALHFCGWLDPRFQVWMMKAFSELMRREFDRKNLEFHIRKITDNIEEARNWLDTIPFQDPSRKGLKEPDA